MVDPRMTKVVESLSWFSADDTPTDPMQAKVLKMMPIMFTAFMLFFPSGLVLYWVVNNTLSIVQQAIITRQIEGGGKKA